MRCGVRGVGAEANFGFLLHKKGLLFFCVTHAPAGNGAKATCFPRRGDGVGGGDFVSWGRWAMTGAGGFVSRGWLPNCWTGSLFHGTPPQRNKSAQTSPTVSGAVFVSLGGVQRNKTARGGVGVGILFHGPGWQLWGGWFCFAGWVAELLGGHFVSRGPGF